MCNTDHNTTPGGEQVVAKDKQRHLTISNTYSIMEHPETPTKLGTQDTHTYIQTHTYTVPDLHIGLIG